MKLLKAITMGYVAYLMLRIPLGIKLTSASDHWGKLGIGMGVLAILEFIIFIKERKEK